MEKDHPVSSSDEIDLGELLLRLTKVVSRHIIKIAGLTFMGVTLGVVYFNLKKPVYESSMMLQSDILTEAYSETLTDNLKKLIDERNSSLIAKKLSIDETQAAALVDIKVESVADVSGAEGATKNFIFLITVETSDNNVLPDLEIGIIQFLKNNHFVKKRVTLKQERYQALVDQMKSEAKELDSLKRLVNEGVVNKNTGGNLVLLDPSNIYEQALKTYKEELSYQEQLELIESIQLIEGFTAFNRPLRPKLAISIASGFGLGIILAGMLIFVIETRRYLRSIDK